MRDADIVIVTDLPYSRIIVIAFTSNSIGERQVPSENPYAKGSGPWNLFESATQLAREPDHDDEQAKAMDRRTVALYRIGAELASGLDDLSRSIASLGEKLRDNR